jgi:hypothetical protein
MHSISFSIFMTLHRKLTCWMTEVLFPAGTAIFSLHHRVQIGSAVHPASYPMGTGGICPGDKAAEA